MALAIEAKRQIFSSNQRHKTDTGSPEVQIALLSQRISLLELNEATCHWPVGDPASPEFFFCGGKALPSLPYCAHHSRIAYQPTGDRRRQAPKTTR